VSSAIIRAVFQLNRTFQRTAVLTFELLTGRF
jgi:hypothetical protein